ncbi:glycoside hydrolase family 43 protein [uncultured Acetatifactor sp.]|uniref:glycoside hydrolase family 43 protein n=1 Tax=uncultured Acetatifactor sp. TaxID=1671927 RepID=UPI00261E8186|nr:glycoside hydrolase family 43 protein [uncultured Acetatifactor sp.]
MIHNPILRGFHPDPSIIRAGTDYYIATSTFEWWPGVRIHHSRDLVHWSLIGYPLTRMSQMDLRGVGPSQGIWAPCLTYDNGVFYLVYTIVKAFYCNMYDTENYLVTAEDIHGPWSEPVALNNFGFDPSLFHDDDGRKYMVSMVTDHRVPKKYAGRLVLQEFDAAGRRMVGPVRDIYRADGIFLEGPHIFKRDGWYYLFSADTGTGEAHGQTIQRARDIWGPYEMYRPADACRQEGEAYSILTSRHHGDILLQKAGHCDLVETPEGEWYMVHLCGRASEDRNPDDAERFAGARRYMLGRETAIQKVRWTEDGWLELAEGGNVPLEEAEEPRGGNVLLEEAEEPCHGNVPGKKAELSCCGDVPKDTEDALDSKPLSREAAGGQDYGAADKVADRAMRADSQQAGFIRDDFDAPALHLDYQSLRIPMDEHYISLSERPGWLRMYGRSGLASRFSQTLIARRVTEYHMDAACCAAFEPEVFKQMAGLILMYDTDNYLYLHISHDEDVGKCITLLKAENKKYEYLTDYIPIERNRDIELKLSLRGTRVQFSYGFRGEAAREIGPCINGSFLSDEACTEGWFTGAMVGICCQDLTGFGKYADFDWFEVQASQV